MSQPTCVIYDRLSRLFADEAPDHRITACKAYAAQRGWKVVHIATDTNVSGATRLEDRPGMREVLSWLPRADYVLASKLDRYARSVLEFQRLLKAAASTATTVITADGMVSPENSSFIVNVLASFAEYEREMITARITESKKHFRSKGAHMGGIAPYGYRTVGGVNKKRWAIDDPAAAVLRECADRLINHGASLIGLTQDLNDRGILPPADHARQRDGRKLRNQRWHSTTLRDVLYTPSVRGWAIQAAPGTKRSALTNHPVLDAEGQPISTGPAVLDAETWSAVRAILDGKAKGRGTDRTGKALLLHIAECSECAGPLYRQRRTSGGKDYGRYVCPNGVGQRSSHRSNAIAAPLLEEMVTAEYLARFGTMSLMRWAEPDGSAVLQLSEVAGQIERLAGNLAQLDPAGPAARMAIGQITALEARQRDLQTEAGHAEGRWVDAGGTVAEVWQSRGEEGRRNLLESLGARIVVSPVTPGAPKRFDPARIALNFAGPAWWREDDPAAAHLVALELEELLSHTM
ncbi:recombinase family protein [Streptomyces sp. A1547]|uniref:recombinase family protein n=1 Tax=Streptomyces sp. A1547 TaxID=2563105 RepID=UPI00109EA58D|nr:recombinase family protein [Streptomyces sp. A1547]THA38451.1 recombinase family protein [Streptomyces sp. A1547]